jgi:hypothetical protein
MRKKQEDNRYKQKLRIALLGDKEDKILQGYLAGSKYGGEPSGFERRNIHGKRT